MIHFQRWHALRRFLMVVLMGVLAFDPVRVQPVRAGDLDKLDSSLKWIPADAAFYSSLLRNREQIEAVANSRAWAKLTALPAVKQLRQMLEAGLRDPNPQLASLLELYRQPENQQLVELVGDIFSDEVFVYGGGNTAGFLELLGRLLNSWRFGNVTAMLSNPQRPNIEAGAQVILRALADNVELIQFPDLIVGFKLRKPDRGEAQLKRLEQVLNALVEKAPPLKGRFKRAKIAGGDFLTLALDGSMVPWEQSPIKLRENEAKFDKLVKKLNQVKLTLSLGIRDNYLLFALGESTGALTKLGQGDRLIDRPEFKPLARHADQRLTSISYASQALRARTMTTKKDMDALVGLGDLFFPKLNLPAEQQEEIRKDLAELAKDLKRFIPEPGATLAFSFLTPRGSESYSYDWGEQLGLEGSKPLTLLNHVGGTPLLAVAGRSKYAPENYELLIKWLKVAERYFEEIALPKLDADAQEKYEQLAKVARPFLKRVHEITGKMLLPALADGQSAFVLDGKLKSKQWHQAAPGTEKPMPMLEPALVVGVSDAALLRKAFGEYRSSINDLMAKLHELNPQIPDAQIPEPATRELKSGTLYFYPLPPEFGLDPQILPIAGLSDKVAVLAISQTHSMRLLTTKPLETDGGPLDKLNRPLAGAAYCNCEGLVNLFAPWVEMGIHVAVQRQKAAEGGSAEEGGPSWMDIVKQVPTVLEVLKVFRSYSSATYFEDKALVTHRSMVIRDL